VTRPIRDDELTLALATGRNAWPGIQLEPGPFGAHLAARVDADGATLAELHVADLALTCACLARDPVALAAFERELRTCADAAVRRAGGDASTRDEVLQRLRERLVVGDHTRGARLAEYSGRGPLQAWLRVVITRETLALGRRAAHEAPLGEATLDGLESPTPDPELEYLRSEYRDAFRAAFTAAFSALEPLEREVLRQHHLHGATIDDLAARHAVHRATAARWLARARDRLLIGTRERLSATLAVDGDELDSILRLVRSKLDVTLRTQP
jgi:RNA polymerase sigma-70 factor (ECF subfamily)